MKIKIQITIVFALLIGYVVYRAATTESKVATSLPRFTVTEFLSKQEQNPERFTKQPSLIMGNIKDGTIKLQGDTAYFNIHIGKDELPIYYNGPDGIPDTFKAGAQALVEGTIGADGTFNAYKISTKCASKYKPENVN